VTCSRAEKSSSVVPLQARHKQHLRQTRHTSHVARHTTHATPHTSHATRQTSPASLPGLLTNSQRNSSSHAEKKARAAACARSRDGHKVSERTGAGSSSAATPAPQPRCCPAGAGTAGAALCTSTAAGGPTCANAAQTLSTTWSKQPPLQQRHMLGRCCRLHPTRHTHWHLQRTPRQRQCKQMRRERRRGGAGGACCCR
jgi:hypothetical protein